MLRIFYVDYIHLDKGGNYSITRPTDRLYNEMNKSHQQNYKTQDSETST
jgi:hypothetical protein